MNKHFESIDEVQNLNRQNYIPSAPEVVWLSQRLEELRSEIRILEARLALLKCVEEQYVSDSAARRLPIELLGSIFEYCCLESAELNCSPQHLPALDLSHVCHLWREITWFTAALWSRIAIEISEDHIENPHGSSDSNVSTSIQVPPELFLLGHYLRRSESIPLHIVLYTDVDVVWEETLNTEGKEWMRNLGQEQMRWYSLQISIGLACHLSTESVASLRSLEFTDDNYDEEDAPLALDRPLFDACPHLTQFVSYVLPPRVLNWTRIPFGQLTTLICELDDPLDIRQCFGERNDTLETLVLRSCVSIPTPEVLPPSGITEFAKLRKLRIMIEVDVTEYDIFAYITAPSLISFSCSPDPSRVHKVRLIWPQKSFIGMILPTSSSKSSPLRSFSLVQGRSTISEEEIVDIMNLAPALTRLAVCSSNRCGALLLKSLTDVVKTNSKEPPFAKVPYLEELVLYVPLTDSADFRTTFVGMLLTRALNSFLPGSSRRRALREVRVKRWPKRWETPFTVETVEHLKGLGMEIDGFLSAVSVEGSGD